MTRKNYVTGLRAVEQLLSGGDTPVRKIYAEYQTANPRVEASVDGVEWEPLEARASLADATLSLYRDPRHARGEVRFAPREVRLLRLDPRLPARKGALEIGP